MTIKVHNADGKIEEYPNAYIEWEWDESEKGTDSGWRVHAMDKNCTTVSAFIYPRDCKKIEIVHEESDMIFEKSKGKSLSKGALHILAERMRQIEKEGFDDKHDDLIPFLNLSRAAVCYAIPEILRHTQVKHGETRISIFDFFWPWNLVWWKPSPDNRIRELEKAGALIAAEIDKLLRLENKQGEEE